MNPTTNLYALAYKLEMRNMNTTTTNNHTTTTFNFSFRGIEVRAFNTEPLQFVLGDVCDALGIKNSRSAAAKLDEDEKGKQIVHTPGGPQRVTTVTEPGLYSIVLTSRKPKAKEFKRWITHDVVSSISKDGMYVDGEEKGIDSIDALGGH